MSARRTAASTNLQTANVPLISKRRTHWITWATTSACRLRALLGAARSSSWALRFASSAALASKRFKIFACQASSSSSLARNLATSSSASVSFLPGLRGDLMGVAGRSSIDQCDFDPSGQRGGENACVVARVGACAGAATACAFDSKARLVLVSLVCYGPLAAGRRALAVCCACHRFARSRSIWASVHSLRSALESICCVATSQIKRLHQQHHSTSPDAIDA